MPNNAIKRAGFTLAFITPTPPPTLPAWSTRASRAIDALITLRSLVHKWAAAGSVNEAELAAVYERLEAAGLRGWLDDLLGVR